MGEICTGSVFVFLKKLWYNAHALFCADTTMPAPKNQAQRKKTHHGFVLDAAFVKTAQEIPVVRSWTSFFHAWEWVTFACALTAFFCNILLILIVLPQGEVLFGIKNPISQSIFFHQLDQEQNQLEQSFTNFKEEQQHIGSDLDQLKAFQYTSQEPLLERVYTIQKSKIDWNRAYVGLDQVVKQLISANDILKRITFGIVQFRTEGKSIVIDDLRAFGPVLSDTKRPVGSSISLASLMVDGFESSPYFKDLKVEEFSKKQEISGTNAITPAFTPLTLQFTYQEPDERDPKDKSTNLQQDLQSLDKL